jgi:hypothetical protein
MVDHEVTLSKVAVLGLGNCAGPPDSPMCPTSTRDLLFSEHRYRRLRGDKAMVDSDGNDGGSNAVEAPKAIDGEPVLE